MRPLAFQAAPQPARRRFMKTALAGGAVLGTAAAAGGTLWLRPDAGAPPLDVDAVLERIALLERSRLAGTGAWTPNQIFTHVAQSIEYAMTGYPVMKPAWYRDTVGAAALAAFGRKRKMAHDLAAPIEGAPALDAAADARVGLMRLRHAFIDFRRYSGPLAPHFVYGVLDKAQYEAVHLMHFWNHLEEIEVGA